MFEMRAIPTRYNGYHFRSRLEARWAVVFDALHLSWEYEVQGYQLPSGRYYLPDFIVTSKFADGDSIQHAVEVKGDTTLFDMNLYREFVDAATAAGVGFSSLLLLSGMPNVEPGKLCVWPEILACPCCPPGRSRVRHSWAQLVHGAVISAGEPQEDGSDDKPIFHPDPEKYAETAFKAGRSARFEHGESGAT